MKKTISKNLYLNEAESAQTELKKDNIIFAPIIQDVHTAELQCWRCEIITTDWMIKDGLSYCKDCWNKVK